ncbi:MAG: fibronectin type III domain-containing protein [Gemmatimonadota bacterium]
MRTVEETMGRWMVGILVAAAGLSGCSSDSTVLVPGGGGPAAPVALDVRYYDRSVVVTWELSGAWNGEPFRVYAAPEGGAYVLVAEVTNCSDGLCSYTDVNIQPGATYTYYVASVGFDGVETPTAEALVITVPRVYLYLDGESFLLGETDSEGFLDELAENGLTYEYFVTALDEYGHESAGSGSGFGTPRPDFHGEYLYDFFAVPESSGFIFRDDESLDPLVSGTDPLRHFRLETDAQGWWLVPGPGVSVYPQGFETTALRCGPGSDAFCVALDEAPQSGYVADDLGLQTQTTYVLRVPGDDNRLRYAALRVQVLGFDQDDAPLMIFDWSYQLQPGNPALAPVTGKGVRIR